MTAALRRLARHQDVEFVLGYGRLAEIDCAGRIKDLRAVLEVAEAGLGFLRQTKFGEGPNVEKGNYRSR
jgi:hypothetical protein